MEFPIENLAMPITLHTTPTKKFFVVASAYANKEQTEASVIIQIKNGRMARYKLLMEFPISEDMLKKTNLRTALYKSCVQAQNKLEGAVNKLMKTVLETRRVFDPALIGTQGDCITYNARGFIGLSIKV